MLVKELNWSQIEALYNSNMQEDFPEAERKPLELLRSLHEKGTNHAYGLYEADVLRAYAIFEKPDRGNVWLLDYLAVDKSARGGGFGSLFLKELQKTLKDVDAVMVEIEKIEAALDEEQRDVRIRRKQFYLRNGLLQTGVYTKADGGIDYEILCFPVKKDVLGKAAGEAMRRIYETFFAPGMYEIFD